MTEFSCSVCRSTDLTAQPPIAGYRLARCDGCSHLFVAQEIEPGVLERAYGEPYYAAGASGQGQGYGDYVAASALRLKGFRSYLARLERFVPRRGALLDYGCAIGLFVKVARDQGWDARGYERSEHAVEYGTTELGVNIVLARDGFEPFAAESFDAVTLWDTIEHFEHPRETIAAIHRWLRPGGCLALNTVNSSSLGARLAGPGWRHLAPPHHLQYFTRRSLLQLLRSAGFEILSLYSRGTCLASRREHASLRGWRSITDDVIGSWRVRPVVTALNLFDEIEVIARKRAQEQPLVSE